MPAPVSVPEGKKSHNTPPLSAELLFLRHYNTQLYLVLPDTLSGCQRGLSLYNVSVNCILVTHIVINVSCLAGPYRFFTQPLSYLYVYHL